MSEKSDTPETPPEVLAKQAASRALTRETAELIGTTTMLDEGGRLRDGAAPVAVSTNSAARKRAEKYAGGTPVAGLTPAAVAAMKAKDYPKGPKMDPELGDRTPAFVNWLWANHPADAKVRFAYRDIWPTTLPATWSPASPAKAKPAAKKPAASTPAIVTL